MLGFFEGIVLRFILFLSETLNTNRDYTLIFVIVAKTYKHPLSDLLYKEKSVCVCQCTNFRPFSSSIAQIAHPHCTTHPQTRQSPPPLTLPLVQQGILLPVGKPL